MVGFIFLALISGFFVEKFTGNIVMAVIGMVLGTAVTYAFGTIWLCAQMHLTFVQGLYAGVIPYLPGDAAKIVIAIIVGSAVKKVYKITDRSTFHPNNHYCKINHQVRK